jgi:hypothetical protein
MYLDNYPEKHEKKFSYSEVVITRHFECRIQSSNLCKRNYLIFCFSYLHLFICLAILDFVLTSLLFRF